MTLATRSAPLAAASASSPRRAAIRLCRTAALCCALPVLATAARADWLVTEDGQRIETKGPWEVRGRRVVYTTTDGTLSSLRLSALDLEESERLTREGPTREGARSQAERAPAAVEPVLVLTDENTPRAPGPTSPEPAAEGERPAAAPQSGGDPLRIVSYQDELNVEDNQLEVSGRVSNSGDSILTRMSLSVLAFDEAGNLVGRAEASFEQPLLRPGESSEFTAVFPNLTIFDSLRFRPSSRGIQRVEKGEEPPREGETGEGGE